MTPQHSIVSGFGHDSTTAQVLSGVDLSGQVVIVTGGYSGFGLEISRGLPGAGAHVIVPARRPAVASGQWTSLLNWNWRMAVLALRVG
ncbi:MAG: hypothetical protein R2686_06050 [Candidatus Nanopelagicales bacterium]